MLSEDNLTLKTNSYHEKYNLLKPVKVLSRMENRGILEECIQNTKSAKIKKSAMAIKNLYALHFYDPEEIMRKLETSL